MCFFKNKKKSDVGKIYKTTDGYFTGNNNIKKPRRVAVTHQRKDDGALAVRKIYSQKQKSGNSFVPGIVLSPKNHSSLTEDSIVGTSVEVGAKDSNKKLKPIFARDFTSTNDKLTKKELKVIKKNAGATRKNRKTSKKKLKKWKRHFK